MRFNTFIAALAVSLLLPAAASAKDASVTVTLTEQNGSGVSGTATLTQMGNDLQVDIALAGAKAGTAHPFHLHTGACPNPGGVAYPLSDAVDGKSTTTLTGVMLASVADGTYAINGHDSKANLALYITCGDIAAMAAAPPAGANSATERAPRMPATGGSDSSPAWLFVFGLLALSTGLVIRLRQGPLRND